jgi:hypothetical protein
VERGQVTVRRSTSAFDELFLFCASKISPDVIARSCPSDPGYKAYVNEWHAIWRDRKVPIKSNFEISETVGLTMWDESRDAEFLWFRCFANSVALKLMCVHRQEVVFDLNYPLICLLTDMIGLRDTIAVKRLQDAVEAAQHECVTAGIDLADGLPWLAHTRLLLAALTGNTDQLGTLATRAIEAENQFRTVAAGGPISHVFLLGLTTFETLHPVWKDSSSSLLAPHRATADISFILNGISKYKPAEGSIRRDLMFGKDDFQVFHSS